MSDSPLTVEELTALSCDCGRLDCVLVLKPRCHQKALPIVRFVKRTGTIVITCSVCEKHVTEIAVASKPPRVLQ